MMQRRQRRSAFAEARRGVTVRTRADPRGNFHIHVFIVYWRAVAGEVVRGDGGQTTGVSSDGGEAAERRTVTGDT